MPGKKHKVVIYSTPTCPYCHAAKEYLTEKKIKFQDIDVSKDKKAANDMIEKSGQMGVPVIIVDNKTVIVGFDKDALKKALGLK